MNDKTRTALFRDVIPSLSMADVRAHLRTRREKRDTRVTGMENIGIAYVKAFGGLGKAAKPISRRKQFEAHKALKATNAPQEAA